MTNAAARPKRIQRAPAATRREFCDAKREKTPKPETAKAQYGLPDDNEPHWGEGLASIMRRLQ